MAAEEITDPGDVLVRPGEGEAITDLEHRQAILLAAHDDITMVGYRLADGEHGPDPHVHHEHTDAFYVLDGELSFLLGPDRERIRMAAGGLVAAPPNVVHTFANESGGVVRFLNLHTPDGGFAGYMRARRDGDDGASFDSFEPPADGGLPLSEAVVSGPGEGERLVRGNRVVLLKAVLPSICFAEFEVDGPLGGPHLHQHDDQVDSFYVLDGDLEFTIEDSRHVAGPGTLASIPRGVRHTFAHAEAGTARFLNIHAPDAGFGDLLRRDSD